jgi:radical SAM protein with 4Fe4S-binding SPASM domain
MLGRFHSLYFETTRNCNLSCKYCSTGSESGKKTIDLSFNDIVTRILDPAYELGTRLVSFSGGEFLLRHDSYDILNYANEKGFNIAMASNGILLTDEVLSRIKNIVGDNLVISLGINSFDLSNIKTRNVETEFILKILDRLEKFNIRVNISVTIGQFNKESFENTIDSINQLKLPFNRIPFVPRSCNAHTLMFDSKTLRDFFHPVLRNNFRGQVSYTPFMLPPDEYERISGQVLQKEQIPLNPSIGCWIGAYYAINAEGEVSPCPMFSDHVSGGNVFKTPLKEILFESDLFQKITDRSKLEGKCGNCKYTHTCGGCRVMSYYKTGNVYAEDPTCFIDDLTADELTKIEEETVRSFKNYVRMAKFGNLFNSTNKEE